MQEFMLEIVKPGMREDDLATELRWYSKSLGAPGLRDSACHG
jgi:hypothetical protein